MFTIGNARFRGPPCEGLKRSLSFFLRGDPGHVITMKVKLITIVLLAAALIAAVIARSASTIQKQPIPFKNRLEWYAKEAKNKGEKKIVVPALLVEYLGDAGTISAEDAFTVSTVVIAHVVAKESYYRDDQITTWNKFAIEEVISEAKEVPCPGCLPPEPPSSLLPLSSGELLIPQNGGRVNIDGVEVVQVDEFYPEYEIKEKYVLLITLYPSGVARTIGGPVGVFRVLQNEKLVPIRDSEHKIRRDFKDQYNSLDKLRKHLKHKP